MNGNSNQAGDTTERDDEPAVLKPRGPKGRGPGGGGRMTPRRAARLAAIQALYQIDIAGGPVTRVIAQFLGGQDLPMSPDRPRARPRKQGEEPAQPRLGVPDNADRDLFQTLVTGALGEPGIDDMIAGGLSDQYSLDRLEAVLRAILRAAVFELARGGADTPPKVVISEYVGLAESFFSEREPALVNAVLDRLARTLNPDAFPGGPAADGDADTRD